MKFVVAGNSRLEFKHSRKIVQDFIAARLAHRGLQDVIFLQNADEALRAAAACRDDSWVLLDIMNPLVDLDLISSMILRVQNGSHRICVSDGAIPGTQPLIVGHGDVNSDAIARVLKGDTRGAAVLRWHTQRHYNNQFNLYKFKRLKMFLGLVRIMPDMAALSIDEFCKRLGEDEIFPHLIRYFEPGDLIEYSACPHCDGALESLPVEMSQPMIGYLPPSRPCYHECQACGLIVLSPSLGANDVHRIYDEFDSQDFLASANDPYVSAGPRCNLEGIENLLPPRASTIDLGGGIGRFSLYLKKTHPEWTVTHADFETRTRDQLRADGVLTRSVDMLREEIGDCAYDLATAWEVVEHIPFSLFDEVLAKIHRALRPGGIFLFSTPDFDSPLCRAFDFFNICPPFHYTVFRTSWLETYFDRHPEWHRLQTRPNSDLIDDAVMWFDYAERTAPTFPDRALASVCKALFASPAGAAAKKALLDSGIGSEVIMAVQKTRA